jgi:RNA polymerase sigma factor (sigma-70 family)
MEEGQVWLFIFPNFWYESVQHHLSVANSEQNVSLGRPPVAVFATTHWSAILEASQRNSPRADAAVSQLYTAYWYPLYAFIRGRGYDVHDAQDLAQDFFASLLKKNHFQSVTREKGRFRSYLLGALKHFLANEWHKARREKRGGGCAVIPLDEALAENRYSQEPSHDATPEKLFEQNWASVLLERVLMSLRAEQEGSGKGRHFDALKIFLTGEKSERSYAEIGAGLEMSEAAVKVAVHRLRERYRELLRAEIANTVANPGEVEDELRYLLTVLRGA